MNVFYKTKNTKTTNTKTINKQTKKYLLENPFKVHNAWFKHKLYTQFNTVSTNRLNGLFYFRQISSKISNSPICLYFHIISFLLFPHT